jgi:hypothetical protein
MERDDIQVEMLSLSTHCPPCMESRIHYLFAGHRVWRGMIFRWKCSRCHALSRYGAEDTLPISEVQSMESDDIQVETLSLSTHCPGIERRIRYLLAW